jgi:uncharacterized membrane protein (DUF373 family)
VDQASKDEKHPLIVIAEKGKRIIAGVLLVMMLALLGIAVLELVWMPLTIAIPGLPGGADSLILTEKELLDIFGVFLSVLIALELVETVEVYFKDHEVHAEIVLLVALIAIARKVVLLDLGKYDSLTILGLAALFIGIAAAYMAIKWANRLGPEQSPED